VCKKVIYNAMICGQVVNLWPNFGPAFKGKPKNTNFWQNSV